MAPLPPWVMLALMVHRIALIIGALMGLVGCGQSSSSSPASDANAPAPYSPAPNGTSVMGLDGPSHIVSDGYDLYVTAGGEWAGSPGVIEPIPLDGGAPAPFASANAPWGLAIDDAYVYWADQSPDGGVPVVGVVRRAPKDGGAAETLAQSPGPEEVAVDSTTVYWSSRPDMRLPSCRSRNSGRPRRPPRCCSSTAAT